VLGSQREGDDAAHGVGDQVKGAQVLRLDKACLDRLDVVFQSVHAVRRLGALAEAQEIHREQPAVEDGGFAEHRLGPEGRRRREAVHEGGILGTISCSCCICKPTSVKNYCRNRMLCY
jgi:hypothetical protein